MRKVLIALVAILLASLSLTATAEAQDVQAGTVVADPQFVPAAGEYTFTATGSDFIPNTSVLLLKCTLPGDTVTSVDEAIAAAAELDPLADCDISAAQNVEVDGEGGWTAELTAEVGDNFLLSAGDLAGTQAGGAWVPIISAETISEDAEEEELAETGVETGLLAVVGTAVLGAGVLVVREGRRFRQ
jgi:hypothetical protein